ncbi:hypothetical protein BDV93DRAFT_609333 [Ceratobasidium sp. AG-I]|nr:hypothetical protein BDV93DRAFT_609333 [Ceratobasidium sp. AG-I]
MQSPLEANVAVSMVQKDQTIDEALGEWNLARTAFAAALQTYLDTFSHFELICSQLFDSKEHDTARPDVCAVIDDEAVSLATREPLIISTRTRLLQLRNRSRSASPIAALPVEVLGRIFILTIDSCRAGAARLPCPALWIYQVNSISSVCSRWRSTALSTRQLWTYIDFEELHHANYVDLWLDRAGSYPLDIARVIDSEHDEDGDDRFCSMLPLMERVRSMALSSKAYPIEQWISEWCAGGLPHTLTTLVLSAPWEYVNFPPREEIVDRERLTELLYSLSTLYLSHIRVNWGSLTCQNLVSLSLLELDVTTDGFRHVLMNNLNLQHIRLSQLDVTKAPTSAALPPIQLPWLHTVHLEFAGSYQLLAMIAPGQCRLTMKMERSYMSLDNSAERDLVAFCRRSHITKLHCHSREVLELVVTAESKIEVISFEHVELDNSIYDLIVPPPNGDPGSPSAHLQSRLPHLHSIYISGSRLKHPEGFRRVISACSIREIGIDGSCDTESGPISRANELKKWVGPGINASFVLKERDVGYSPFDG